MLIEPDASTTMVTALLGAANALAVTDPGRAMAPLRRLLTELLAVTEPPDTTTPPTQDAAGGASAHPNRSPRAASSVSIGRHPARRPGAKPTRQPPDAATTTGPTMTPEEWLELRAIVRQRYPSNTRLASAIGLAVVTTEGVMSRRSPPSRAIAVRLRALLGNGVILRREQRGRQRGRRAGTGASGLPRRGGWAGGTGAGPADVKALANRLRAKRRPLALTSTTLAGQIGVEPDELDDALHARPVPAQAAERLAAWAAAG